MDSENKNTTDGKETVNYGGFNLVNMNTSDIEQAERSKYADTDILSNSQISRKKSGMNNTLRKQSERKNQLNKDIDMVETAKSSYRKRPNLTERSESQIINQVNSPSNNLNQKAMTPVLNTTMPPSMQSNTPSNPALGIQGQSVVTINTRKPIMTSNVVSPQIMPSDVLLQYQPAQMQMDVGIGSDVPFNQDDYKQSSLDNSERSGSESQKSGVVSSKRLDRQVKNSSTTKVDNRKQENQNHPSLKVFALQQKSMGMKGSPKALNQIQSTVPTLTTKNSPNRKDTLLSPNTALKAALNEENQIYNSIYKHQEGVINTLKKQNRDLKQMNFRSPLIQTNVSQRTPDDKAKQKKVFRLKQANEGFATPELGNTFHIENNLEQEQDGVVPLSKIVTRELNVNSHQSTEEEVIDNFTPYSQRQIDKIKNSMPSNPVEIIENDTFSVAGMSKANPTPIEQTFNDSHSALKNEEPRQKLPNVQIKGDTFTSGAQIISPPAIVADEQSLKNSHEALTANVLPNQNSFGVNFQIDHSSSKNSIQIEANQQISEKLQHMIQTQNLNEQSTLDIDEMLHDVQKSFGRRRKTAFEKKERLDEEMRQMFPDLTERNTRLSNEQVSHAQYSMSEFRNQNNTRTPIPLMTSQIVFQQSSARSPKMTQTMQNFPMNGKQPNLNMTASTFGKVTMADTSRMNKTLKDFDRPIPKHQLQIKTPNPDLAPFIERFNQSNALSKFSEILMKKPVNQDINSVVPKPRRLESFAASKLEKPLQNPFDRKRITMSQFDYSCSQQLSVQRNNALQRTQNNFNKNINSVSIHQNPLIVKKFENNGIQRQRKFVVENNGIQIRNLKVKESIFKEKTSEAQRFKSVPKQRLSDAEALYLNQNIYKKQKSKDGFPFGLQTQLISQNNRSKRESVLDVEFKDKGLENDPHLVTLNSQTKTPMAAKNINYNHDSGTLQREEESTGQIKKIEVSSSKRKKNLQISKQNSPKYLAMKSITKSADSSEYSQVSAKYSGKNNLNGDESQGALSEAGGEAINNVASPFTSSNGANLQAIFTSGVKNKQAKNTSQKRSAAKQKESILKKKKIKKANAQASDKKNNEMDTVRSSQSKTVEAKERGSKIKSIISIVEHNKRKAGPQKKIPGQRKVSVLTDDESQYLYTLDQAKQMTMRRKMQQFTGGPVFKTIQRNYPPQGIKLGLPSANSPLGQAPISLKIQQVRSTHEENLHMRYPSSKFNSIGVINPNSEINERIWRQIQAQDLKVKFDKKGKGLIRLLDKDEYYGYMPERGALKDSGTQISPMVHDDENAYNPSLLSLDSMGDRDTQQGNKTGKFSFRVGQQSSATRDFEKYTNLESQDKIQTYPLTTKHSQSVIVGPDGQLSAASPKSFKLITDTPGPTLIWFEQITGELPTDTFTLGFDSQIDIFFMKSSHGQTRRLDMDQEQFFPEGIEMGETIESLQQNIKEEIASRVNRNLNLYLNNELDDSIQIIISLAPRMMHNIVSKRSSTFMLPQQQVQGGNQDVTQEMSKDIEVSQKGQGQSMADDTEISNIDNTLTYNIMASKKLNDRSPGGRQEASSGLYFESTPAGIANESQGEVQVDNNTNDDQIMDSERRLPEEELAVQSF